jgi:hypothetical protein
MSLFISIWNKYLGGRKKPWIDLQYVDGKLVGKDFNKAFIESVKKKHEDLTVEMNDQQVVELFLGRENLDIEEPRLEVLHSGITEDGRVKMTLDWNTAFIRHLADNGIMAETEEEAIQQYMSLLTHNIAEDMHEGISKNHLDEAFKDLEAETLRELEEAARQAEENVRTSRKLKRRRVVN